MDMTDEMPLVSAGEVSGALAMKASLIAAAAEMDAIEGAEPISLEEAKAHLRVIGDDEDGYIQDLITAAREMAEGRLNRTIVQRTRTEVFASWRDSLVLLKPPVVSVESVAYTDVDGQVQTLESEFYYAGTSTEPAVIELSPQFRAPALHFRSRPIAVTYTAGYPEGDVPRAICQWILLAIGTLYQNRESLVNGVSVASLPADFMALLLQPYMVYE